MSAADRTIKSLNGSIHTIQGFPGWGKVFPVLVVKNPPANAEDTRDADSTPGSGRSPGGGKSNPLRHSCLENPMDGEIWQAAVHSIA